MAGLYGDLASGHHPKPHRCPRHGSAPPAIIAHLNVDRHGHSANGLPRSKRGIGLVILSMGGVWIHATRPASLLTILAGVATWEREIVGKYKGRPVSIDAAQIRQLRAELGPAAIAKRLGIARSSVYRALA